ncbi:hypothetical protein [Streptomyces triticagri]|uniref:hypothetical protein n=1 Tax=Streptomyces triticagri TaxID=2293568 RepID=UPI0013146DEC|nr:hypothetical protein [Streptomyces triticagri]
MSSASFTHAPVRTARHHGTAAAAGHRIGSALRAAKVFAGAAIGVVLLGESTHDTEAGVRRR